MKTLKKIVLLLMILVIGQSGVAYAESIIRAEVSPGYEGVVLPGALVPVTVELESIGSDLDGRLKISYIDEDMRVTVASEVPVQLLANSTKEYVVPLMIEQDVYTYQEDKFLLVEVFNNAEKRLYAQEVGIVEIASSNDLITGILSENYVGLTYFNLGTVQYANGNTKNINSVKLTNKNFEEAAFIEAIDVLVIDAVDAQLSELSLTNIDEWVRSGGLLLMSTGEQIGSQEQFLKQFDISLSKKMIEAPLYDFEMVKQIEVDEDQWLANEELQGIYSKGYGQGSILLSSYSLSGKQIVESSNNTQMISRVLETQVAGKAYDQKVDQNNFRRLRNILNRVPKEQMPSVQLIMFIVSAYLLLVGPFGYYMLKKRNQSTYYWRLVAVMSFAATIVVFLAGRGIDFNKTVANGLTIVDQRNESAQATTFLGMKYSGIGDVDVAPESGVIKWTGSFDYGESPKEKTYYTDAGRQRVIFGDVKKFQFVNMMVENRLDIDNKHQEIILSEDETQIKITNPFDYPLTDVVVIMNGMTKYIERIDAKAVEEIAVESTVFNQTGRRWSPYAFYDHIDPNLDALYEKNSIVEAFFDSIDNGRMDMSTSLLVFGFIENETILSMDINDKNVDVHGHSFWVDSLELGRPTTGPVKLPYGAIIPSTSLNGDTYYDSYDQSYYGYGEAIFAYQVPKWLKGETFTISFSDRHDVVYKIYDYEQNLWVEEYFSDGNYEIQLEAHHVSEDNMIRAMIQNNNGDYYYAPLLEVKGVVAND